MGRLGAILGVLERSWAVLEASWAAWVGCLGRHGSLGEPQGGALAAQGPLVIGAVQAAKRAPEGGVPFRRLQELWHSCTPQRAGAVADRFGWLMANARPVPCKPLPAAPSGSLVDVPPRPDFAEEVWAPVAPHLDAMNSARVAGVPMPQLRATSEAV